MLVFVGVVLGGTKWAESFGHESAFRAINGAESKCASSNSSLVESLKISTPEKQPIECYDQKCVRKKCWCKGQSWQSLH